MKSRTSEMTIEWQAQGWLITKDRFGSVLDILHRTTENGVAIARVEFASSTIIVDLVFPPVFNFHKNFRQWENHRDISPLIPGDAGQITLEECLYVPVKKMLSILHEGIEQKCEDVEVLQQYVADLIKYKRNKEPFTE